MEQRERMEGLEREARGEREKRKVVEGLLGWKKGEGREGEGEKDRVRGWGRGSLSDGVL